MVVHMRTWSNAEVSVRLLNAAARIHVSCSEIQVDVYMYTSSETNDGCSLYMEDYII